MSSSETLSGDLTELQHRSRERSLTGHHASRAHHDAESIVLAGSGMILVSAVRGDVPREYSDSRGFGLFHRDTRFLSVYELTLNGAALVPLSSHEGGGAWTFHVLCNPQLESPGGGCIPPYTITIRRDRAVEGPARSADRRVGPAERSMSLPRRGRRMYHRRQPDPEFRRAARECHDSPEDRALRADRRAGAGQRLDVAAFHSGALLGGRAGDRDLVGL